MAVAALVACNKEAAIETPQGDAIAFGDTFIENSTKAIYETAANLTEFTVWGNVKGTNSTPIALYPKAGASVSRGEAALGAAWTCDVTRYWIPSCNYNFTAIANGTGTALVNGIPTKIAYSINSTDPADLIYGVTTASTDASGVPTSGVNDAKVVTFTMEHLLARLQVSFQNMIPEDVYTYDIKNVNVTTWDKGVYTIGEATPWAQDDNTGQIVLSYGKIESLANSTPTVATGSHLVIPGSAITLSFEYVLKLNETEIYSTSVSKSVTLESVKGRSYSLNVQLKAGNKIDFSVSETNGLGAWGDAGSSEVTL